MADRARIERSNLNLRREVDCWSYICKFLVVVIESQNVIIILIARCIALMQIFMAHSFVMFGCMVLCKVIGAVDCGLAPVDVILALAHAIANPIKSHVDCFGPFLFDGVIGETGGRGVVGFDGSGWLWVPKLGQARPNRASFFSVVK